MIKVLLVEDDKNLSYIIEGGLEDVIGGYEVKTAENGKEGLMLWKAFKPEVIITDIDMPEMNGYQMVEKIRETDGDTLIFFSSGMHNPKNVAEAYKLGANDYIKKPFVPEEIDAHIKALLKLKNGAKSRNETGIYKVGSFTFNTLTGDFKDDAIGNTIHITGKEALVLKILAANKGDVVRRDAIIEYAWEKENDFFSSRSLDVVTNGLRKKLSENTTVKIETIRGIGLCLVEK